MGRRLIAAVLIAAVAAGGGLAWWLARGAGGADGPPAAGPARAVVVNVAGDLELVGDDGSRRQLTSDASSRLKYLQVTPAPDGTQVAYVRATLAGADLMVQPLDGGEPRRLFDGVRQRPFYLAWSPDSRWLSFLASDEEMHLYVAPADGGAEAEELRAGQPSYFAWTPDSSRLLMHIGGAGPRGGLFLREMPGGELERLAEQPGDFQAPGWDAAGAARFVVVSDGKHNHLARVAGGASSPLTAPTEDAIIFSVSPDRERVALVTVGEEGRSQLQIVAAGAAAAEEPSRPAQTLPLAFFWSPDGSKIAVLSIASTGVGPSGGGIVFVAQRNEPPGLRWEIVDLAAGTSRLHPPFAPSYEFANLLPYFDQYATSLALWSPAGDRLIYGTGAGVMALRVSDGSTELLSEGQHGVWVPR